MVSQQLTLSGGGAGQVSDESSNPCFSMCIQHIHTQHTHTHTHTQLAATELVVNDDGEIREANRIPGENEVR